MSFVSSFDQVLGWFARSAHSRRQRVTSRAASGSQHSQSGEGSSKFDAQFFYRKEQQDYLLSLERQRAERDATSWLG